MIHVMAGAIADADGRILVAKRPDHVHLGGHWEFPGGKLEPGESPAQGLARELDEELGIQVLDSRPLIRIHHDYGDRRVLLDVWRVESYAGMPEGREGQPLAWLHPDEMDPGIFPAADRPIITALRLPPLMLITGEDPNRPDEFLVRMTDAIERGVRLIQLRAHQVDARQYRELTVKVHAVCVRHGVRLLLNRDPGEVADLPRHGLHLSAGTLMGMSVRPGRAEEIVSASCHDAAQLEQAARLGLDFAVLSPVKPTATHPGAAAIGWPRFAELVDPIPLPVYALGGLGPDDMGEALTRGAQGIAAIRRLWSVTNGRIL